MIKGKIIKNKVNQIKKNNDFYDYKNTHHI